MALKSKVKVSRATSRFLAKATGLERTTYIIVLAYPNGDRIQVPWENGKPFVEKEKSR